jgi:hypothetical protein
MAGLLAAAAAATPPRSPAVGASTLARKDCGAARMCMAGVANRGLSGGLDRGGARHKHEADARGWGQGQARCAPQAVCHTVITRSRPRPPPARHHTCAAASGTLPVPLASSTSKRPRASRAMAALVRATWRFTREGGEGRACKRQRSRHRPKAWQPKGANSCAPLRAPPQGQEAGRTYLRPAWAYTYRRATNHTTI